MIIYLTPDGKAFNPNRPVTIGDTQHGGGVFLREDMRKLHGVTTKNVDEPEYNPKTQRLITKSWEGYEVVDLTPEQLEARKPKEVSMRQARLALLQSNLLDTVETAVQAMGSQAAAIEWEYAQTVRRDSPITQMLAQGLSLTDEQLDALFELAVNL